MDISTTYVGNIQSHFKLNLNLIGAYLGEHKNRSMFSVFTITNEIFNS